MYRTLLASLALTASLTAATRPFHAFEGDGFDTWKVEGSAFGLAPIAGQIEGMAHPFTGYAGESLAASVHGGEAAKGTLTSPEFTIGEPHISFLIAGGDLAGKTAAQLLIEGKVVRESVGKRSLRLETARWDVTEFIGRKATIRLVDAADGEMGFIAVDHLIFDDDAEQQFPTTTQETLKDGLVSTDVITDAFIPAGTKLSIEATFDEHQLTSPTALTFDDQGRIYLSETHRFRFGVEDDRDHLYWYLDDLASKKVSDRRALHEKWKDKVPLANLTKNSEIIRRLADTDGDGKIDESIVYAGEFNDLLDGTAGGVFFFEDSLYFACIPKIWKLRDTNGDGTADERKVVEEGFGVRVSFSGHDMNGFALGPDGRIYGTIGDRGFSVLTKSGVSYDYPNQGAVFRFEPDGSGFEILHTGLRNPKEIAFDALGNAFTVDNNSDQGDAARVIYLVEGGDSGWQMEHQTMSSFHREIGIKNRPESRWMDEKMWELENPAQPAYMLPPTAHLTSGPSGLSAHPGTGFMEVEAGRFLICDYRGGATNSGIWSFKMSPKGAGMELTDSRKLIWGIAASDVEYSWDGRVFISDFVNGWASHKAGRLVSLDAGEKTFRAAETADTAKLIREGFKHRSAADLAKLLGHADSRVRLRAQIALSRMPEALVQFDNAAGSAEFMARIHGIWGLGMLSRQSANPPAEAKLVSLLADKDPEIRAQCLRALTDGKGDVSLIPTATLLSDVSTRVRFFAAILAGKRHVSDLQEAVCEMLAENNNRDVYLRHAGIFALQNMEADPAALASHPSAAVRLAATVALRRMNNPGIAAFVTDSDPKVADEAIRAICDTDMVGQRPTVAAILDNLTTREWTPFMLRRLIHNAFRIGTAENAERVLRVAANPKLPDSVREEAFRLISVWTEPFPADQFTGHWRPLEKRDLAVIRPALTAALPDLLRQQGFVLPAALDLVRHYELKIAGLDNETLAALTRNTELPAAARATALDLLIAHPPAGFSEFLTEISRDSSALVALRALTGLAKITPDAAIPSLESAVNSKNAELAQQTWAILAQIPGDAVDAIFLEKLGELSAASGISPSAIELLDAAKIRQAPSIIQALAAYEKSIAENSDPLAKWNSSLEGGDVTAGAALFASHPASQCMRCHRAEDGHAAGGETAPNLAGVARRHTDRKYFLESMVEPSAIIAPGFGTVLVELKNGASLSGNLIAKTADHLDIDSAGKALRVKQSDIASFTPPTSAMPPMTGLLEPKELRNLVSWLASLTKGGESTKDITEPELLDPATLAVPKPAAVQAVSTAIDPEIMKIGRQQFMICGACHGQNGEGTAAGPPIAGSEWVTGPEENLIRIQLRGLQGPIKVKGQEYNFPGGMMALAYQNDDQIASVLTYIRNSFGNSAPPVQASAVAALRGEVGKPQVTVADLTLPVAAPKPAASNAPTSDGRVPEVATRMPSGKYDKLARPSALPKWIALGVVFLTLAFLSTAFLKKR